jgi:hypothetical protein
MKLLVGIAFAAFACFLVGGRDVADALGDGRSPREGIETMVIGAILSVVLVFFWRSRRRNAA